MRIRSIVVNHGVVTVTAAAFHADAPNCCADLLLQRSFTWTGNRFAAEPWHSATQSG